MLRLLSKGIIATALIFFPLGIMLSACAPNPAENAPAIVHIAADVQIEQSSIPPDTVSDNLSTENITLPMLTSTLGQQNRTSVLITVKVANFKILNAVSGSITGAIPGSTDFNGATSEASGYLVYYLDMIPESIQFNANVPKVTGPQQQWVVSNSLSHTWQNMEPGMHIFAVQLVDQKGNALSPPVVAAVTLVVQGITSGNDAQT